MERRAGSQPARADSVSALRSLLVIDAARIRACSSVCEVFALLTELGYPAEPVKIVPEEWRRAGIDIAWPDTSTLYLAARTAALDCYVVAGFDLPERDAAQRFLRSLQSYNVLRKPALLAWSPSSMALYDLSPVRDLRRLDIDLRHPSLHALDRLNLLTATASADHARLFHRALDRETLAHQFFERFRGAVRDVDASLRAQCPRERIAATAGEALLVLSRLLFLYFIQQKGWLNGERRFLVDRLDAALQSGHPFYTSVLAPLFFGCLNTPLHQRHLPPRLLGNVPYLNGGLFEPAPFERRHPILDLSNDLIQRIIESVFERFAFSIDESDSAGTHIDPEMLGKVFESLMAEEERAATGSFYTPRAIVDALTERAIAEWCGRDEGPNLLRRLESIAVLDPACGSGAFLLSALQTIEKLIMKISGVLPDRQAIVERSLFGVDLKPEAVRLCELRLWLAIVSQRGGPVDSIPPLPNLDRNIMQGNSLLSPIDFLGDGRADVYREWMSGIRAQADLVARYRSAPAHERPALARIIRSNDQRLAGDLLTKAIDIDERELQETAAPQKDLFGRVRPLNVARCRELHARVVESRERQRSAEEGELDFFSYDVHFAHVMARGGFDVVLGNPPWVRNQRIDARSKRMYADRYRLFRASAGRNTAFHQPDLLIVFFERAVALTAPAGIVALLMPAKVLNAAYAAPLRRAAESLDIVAIDDWSERARLLFDADTFPLGLTVSRRKPSCEVQVTAGGESFSMPQQALAVAGSEWSLLPPDVFEIVSRIFRDHPPLQESLHRRPVMGVKSGDNDLFFLDVKSVRADSVETADGLRVPIRFVARCVRGRDIAAGVVTGASWMLWPPRGGWERIPRWLEKFAEARRVSPDDLRLDYVRSEHLGIKVVWKDVGRGIHAAVLGRGERGVPLVPNQTLYTLEASSMGEARAIANVLSSAIFNALAVITAERAKDFHYRYFGRTIARVPLPADVARALGPRGAVESRPPIDIAAAYGITRDEEHRLAAFLARRLGKAADD